MDAVDISKIEAAMKTAFPTTTARALHRKVGRSLFQTRQPESLHLCQPRLTGLARQKNSTHELPLACEAQHKVLGFPFPA